MKRKWILSLVILLVGLLAFGLRYRAVDQLPIDYDEDDYLAAAQRYASALRQGDIPAIIDYDYNYEHPPLTKLVYGMVLLPLPEAEKIPERPSSAAPASSLPEPHFRNARLASAVFSTMETMALAVISPLAGLFLAINTWQIKYTSQIMLEPLPALLSGLAVVLYFHSPKRRGIQLIFSSVLFGLTVAAKYPYVVAGIAICLDWLIERFPPRGIRTPGKFVSWIRPIVLWGLLAIGVFFLANPRLWNDPLSRFWATIVFHGDYATSEYVRQAGFPFWQPLVWLFSTVPWHPGVFILQVDLYLTLFALAGFRRVWNKQRVFAIWLVVGLLLLILWPTKWPQYILVLTMPLSLSAAEGFQWLIGEPLMRRLQRREKLVFPLWIGDHNWGKIWFESRRAIPWLLPGLAVMSLIVVYPMLFQGGMALTDFSASAIRDGLNGGVWRAVGEGLSGQVEAVEVELFRRSTRKTVNYAGPALLGQLLSGAAADLVVFNVLWTVLAVIGQTILGVGIALLLNRKGLFLRGWWRAVFILPWAIPEFVGALIWAQIFDPRFGWAQQAASAWYARADYPGAVNFIASWQELPNLALFILLIAAIWYGFPLMMLAATAGLKFIPREIYDAASIDGASAWLQFRLIVWPMLLPLLAPAIIIRAIFSFNQFYIFYVMNPPYPLQTFAVTSFFFFDSGGQYAVSAVLNIFTIIILIFLIFGFNRWSKAAEGVTYA